MLTRMCPLAIGGVGELAGVIRHFSDLSFRHVTTKTYAYSRVFGLFRFFMPKKKHALFKHTMENSFFTHNFFFFIRNPPFKKKKKNINYKGLD